MLKEIDMRRKQEHIRPNKTESAVGEEDVASPQSPRDSSLTVHLSFSASASLQHNRERATEASVCVGLKVEANKFVSGLPQATHWSTTANNTNTLPTISILWHDYGRL